MLVWSGRLKTNSIIKSVIDEPYKSLLENFWFPKVENLLEICYQQANNARLAMYLYLVCLNMKIAFHVHAIFSVTGSQRSYQYAQKIAGFEKQYL